MTNADDPEGDCVCPDAHYLDGEAPNDKCLPSPNCNAVNGL